MSRLVPVAVLIVLATACAADVGEGKVAAKVQDAPATTTTAAVQGATAEPDVLALAAPKVLTVDTTKSRLGALGAKVTAQHPIDFPSYEGRVGLDGDTVTALAFRADVASLVSDAPRLTEHLKKEDFLFVEKYPHATFASTQVQPGSDVAGATHTVTGDLTIRGQTKRVTFPAKVEVGASEVKASTEFVVDRRDFGVVYPGKADDLVQDNVLLKVSLVAPRG